VDLDRKVKDSVANPQREQTVAMADKTSVSVLLGQATGLRYMDADSLALRVGTAILGSGFTSRLVKTVRDQEGLTYGVGAGVDDDTFVDGSWMVRATFAPALLQKGITSTRRELDKWYESGVTADELAARKTNMIGEYQVSLASTGGMASAILRTVNRGKDLKWMDEYPKAIDALTVEQVNAAIRKHLDPQKMVLLEAGTLP
jgi:zinc protease